MSKRQEERGRVDIDGWAVQTERDTRCAKVQHRARAITAAAVCGLTQMDRSTASNSDEEIRVLPRIEEHPLPLQTQTCISEEVNIFSNMAFIHFCYLQKVEYKDRYKAVT